ncbi:MAG: DegT/DnrJ/EryC1/StrS family aminotransferase, partial [Syntrophomonadaceae bacterium]|nr:DegT/DnrJ/EryC1/StrS family aminotransferase [Syntrophomonadaceae bacterium]
AAWLEGRSIQTRMLFAGNLVRQPCFDEMRREGRGYRAVGDLVTTDRVMRDTLWIGVYPGLTAEMLDYMAESVRAFLRRPYRPRPGNAGTSQLQNQ